MITKSQSFVAKSLCLAVFISPILFLNPGFAQNTAVSKAKPKAERVLRKVPANRGRLVTRPTKLKSQAPGVPLTCCTHWNTATGGTGCASFDDSDGMCPSDTFQVDCGDDGCW